MFAAWAAAPNGLGMPQRERVEVLIHAHRQARHVELHRRRIARRPREPGDRAAPAAAQCRSSDPGALRWRRRLPQHHDYQRPTGWHRCGALNRAPHREHPPCFSAPLGSGRRGTQGWRSDATIRSPRVHWPLGWRTSSREARGSSSLVGTASPKATEGEHILIRSQVRGAPGPGAAQVPHSTPLHGVGVSVRHVRVVK